MKLKTSKRQLSYGAAPCSPFRPQTVSPPSSPPLKATAFCDLRLPCLPPRTMPTSAEATPTLPEIRLASGGAEDQFGIPFASLPLAQVAATQEVQGGQTHYPSHSAAAQTTATASAPLFIPQSVINEANNSIFCRHCVDCSLRTGGFCDFCLAQDRCPAEVWGDTQRTPLCSKCDRLYNACHFCRGKAWCAPRRR